MDGGVGQVAIYCGDAGLSVTKFLQVATPIVAVAIALAGIFRERIAASIYPPILHVVVRAEPPACEPRPIPVLVPLDGEGERSTATRLGFWFRVWMQNDGDSPANGVEVFAESLEVGPDWKPVAEFLPANLRWTHTDEPQRSKIYVGMGAYFELARVAEEPYAAISGPLVLHTEGREHPLSPGTYRLTLRIAAENLRPFTHQLLIRFDGGFNEDWRIMFSKHVVLKPLT